MQLLRKIFLAKEEKYGEGENTRNFFMKRNIQNLIGNVVYGCRLFYYSFPVKGKNDG